MCATAALQARIRTCPAWCTTEADGVIGLHMGLIHEVGDLAVSLVQAPGEATPTIGMNNDQDEEMTLTLDEAERFGTMLLQLSQDLTFAQEEAGPLGTHLLQHARAGRAAARRAA